MKKNKMAKKTLLIGLTGGIGSGKSLAASYLAAAGYPILSADILAREVTQVGAPALQEIADLFGKEALLVDGTMDRAFVRQAILRDASLRQKLEAITHPRIQALTKERSAAHFAAGKLVVVYEVPLLFEANSHKHVDFSVCVWANDDLRLQRIMARDNCDLASAKKILATQMPQEERKKRSDYLVENNGSEAELKKNVLRVMEEIERAY